MNVGPENGPRAYSAPQCLATAGCEAEDVKNFPPIFKLVRFSKRHGAVVSAPASLDRKAQATASGVWAWQGVASCYARGAQNAIV